MSDTNTELSYVLPSEAVKKGCFERLFQVHTHTYVVVVWCPVSGYSKNICTKLSVHTHIETNRERKDNVIMTLIKNINIEPFIKYLSKQRYQVIECTVANFAST